MRLNCCSSDLLFLLQVIQPFIRKFEFDFGYDIRKRYYCNLMLDFYFVFFALLAWDQAPQWGEKEKRDQRGKISASEASLAVVWGGKSGQTISRLASDSPMFFSFFPQCEAWSQAIALRACLHGVGDPGLVGLVSFVFTLCGTQNKRNLPH